MNIILPQLRRGFNLRFWLATLFTVLLFFSASIKSILISLQTTGNFYHGYANYLIVQTLLSDMLSFFIPAIAALPAATTYLEDVRSKYALFSLIRESYRGYILSHCVACWLCGGGAILLGTLSAWGITTTIFLPLEYLVENPPELGLQVAEQLALLFLNGGLWAVLGMTMSTIMESKYIAYASPFVVYYLLIILYERYFPNLFLIYPREWVNPSNLWPFGFWGSALLMIELALAFALIFSFRAKRRLLEL